VVVIINYTVNPGNIYPPLLISDSHNKPSPKDIVEQLVQSDHGIIVKNDTWNERDLKHALALRPTTAQCAVIGSSHIMQISSVRKERLLSDNCPSLINLGVSGASLEDYLALSETILRNEKPPKVIVFGIDPWSLNFNRDPRWVRYKQDFFNMKSKLEGEYHDDSSSSSLGLLRNLINREYLYRSVQLMLSERKLSIENAPEFDYQVGLDYPVLLPDGSLIYSGKHIRNALASKISDINVIAGKLAAEVYNLNIVFRIRGSRWVTEKAVELFIRLVNHLQQQKLKIIFVLVPSHPAVWNITEQSTAMNVVESKVHEIARLTGAQVIGSYNPGNIGCTADEFFDAEHGKAICLTRLERVSASYHPSKE
jgi:hypothetical protein